MQIANRQKGFTLIEVLVVIGILAVLLALVLIAVNPRQHFIQANNTQRRSDANAILNAIGSYMSQNKGQLPAGIDGTVRTITSTAGASNINLCTALVPTYIADIPLDPVTGTETPAGSQCTTGGATYSSGYTVTTTGGNRVTVAAPAAENGETISVTR
ncbi:MAG TPA: prepilin-type N-terminal cleavage/methylation domain-containing protein [Candidatus Saccharimonadales bacterium]|nr:prepilin-type N-terminal cleavage/methylation domain-containing protein [Candidatus Saccharimonadales bacterium]